MKSEDKIQILASIARIKIINREIEELKATRELLFKQVKDSVSSGRKLRIAR